MIYLTTIMSVGYSQSNMKTGGPLSILYQEHELLCTLDKLHAN